MSRLKAVQDREAGLAYASPFLVARHKLGNVPPGMRVWALYAKLLRNRARMDLLIAAKGDVPMRRKELAQLKLAAMVGCPFSTFTLPWADRKASPRTRFVLSLSSNPVHTFSELEKLVLRLAVAITRTPATASQELFTRLRSELSELALVSEAMAWENNRARFNRVFAIESAE